MPVTQHILLEATLPNPITSMSSPSPARMPPLVAAAAASSNGTQLQVGPQTWNNTYMETEEYLMGADGAALSNFPLANDSVDSIWVSEPKAYFRSPYHHSLTWFTVPEYSSPASDVESQSITARAAAWN